MPLFLPPGISHLDGADHMLLDLAMRPQPEEKMTPLEKIANRVSRYEGSHVAREHSLHLNRCLRAIDGLRVFRDLPKQSVNALVGVAADRRYTAFHKLDGKKL